MKYTDREIRFTSRLEALSHLPYLRDIGWALFTCARCGLSFASLEPSTDFGGILCEECEKDISTRR